MTKLWLKMDLVVQYLFKPQIFHAIFDEFLRVRLSIGFISIRGPSRFVASARAAASLQAPLALRYQKRRLRALMLQHAHDLHFVHEGVALGLL